MDVTIVGSGSVGNTSETYPPDRCHDIHIHHIDKSAGYIHGDFVALEGGTYNCTIEYCTDRNGGHTTDDSWTPAVVIGGYDHTVQYYDIDGASISVLFDVVPVEDQPRGNDVYHNHLHGYMDRAIGFQYRDRSNPDQQGEICGNQIDRPTDANPTKEYSIDVPSGDGIGHTGGNSPWR